MVEKEALIVLTSYVPFGPARINLLISYFGSANKVWSAKVDELAKLGLGEDRLSGFLNHRKTFNLAGYLKILEKKKIKVVSKNEDTYPEELGQIDFAPILLYFKGTLKKSETRIGIVGSRKMTSYGREVAGRFASELATFGICIVSGLARGIDTCAHKATLDAGGRTIAVLGCGLDTVYPSENIQLAENIVNKGGALISEYPLGYPVLRINFASRNRIISGLSKAILVIEGTHNSGTLLTASHAAEQGRSVFAVPGPITSPNSEAPLYLLKNGAKMATHPRDIFEELGLEFKVDREKMGALLPSSTDEEKLLEILTLEPLHLDDIVRISTLDAGSVSARLTIMEIKGLVKNLGEGVYRKL